MYSKGQSLQSFTENTKKYLEITPHYWWSVRVTSQYLSLGERNQIRSSFRFRDLFKWRAQLCHHCCSVAESCRTFVTSPTVACQVPWFIGISQIRILQWVAISFSRGFFQPRNGTQVSCMAGRFFTIWATREASTYYLLSFCHGPSNRHVVVSFRGFDLHFSYSW